MNGKSQGRVEFPVHLQGREGKGNLDLFLLIFDKLKTTPHPFRVLVNLYEMATSIEWPVAWSP